MVDSDGAFKTIWQLSPAELEVLKSDVTGYLDGLEITHAGFAAAATILIWGIITTWDREAHYVWKSRWSYAKAIFLTSRYVAPAAFLCEALGLLEVLRCVIIAWFFIIFCTLTATTASFILAARLYALYERDRRVLGALIVGFLTCFVPGWTLTFKDAGPSLMTAEELRIVGNVYTYIGGVTIQDGHEALDWRLKRCFHFPFPKITNSIVIGSLLFESGIFAALIWKMCRDQGRTRLIEAFYRDGIFYYVIILCNYGVALGIGFSWNPLAQAFLTSSFYVGIKSMMCSHIVLRLRSYFSRGDRVIDGRSEPNPLSRDAGQIGEGDSNSSSMVSTIIHFATALVSEQEREEDYSMHVIRGGEHPNADLEGRTGREEGAMRSAGTAAHPTGPSSPMTVMPTRSLDWTDAPGPSKRHTGPGDALGQDDVEPRHSLQPKGARQSKRSRWFRGQAPDPALSEGDRPLPLH
ncbi:hypothetical protein FRB90_012255 [Tulasnella sp. 427]|nr:hypothetical protein FRB90_012255 [Tulasnella sp. 427]